MLNVMVFVLSKKEQVRMNCPSRCGFTGVYRLCDRVFRALTALRCLPVDVLCGHLDIACLAMDTAVFPPLAIIRSTCPRRGKDNPRLTFER